MGILLFDLPETRQKLLPFTYTRAVAQIRIGILTIQEKWQHHFEEEVSCLTAAYLNDNQPYQEGKSDYLINGALCPDKDLVETIQSLKNGQKLEQGGVLLAARASTESTLTVENVKGLLSNYESISYPKELVILQQLTDIFTKNGHQIRSDFTLITQGRKSQEINDSFTKVYRPENVFLEKGAEVRASVINAEHGPVYLGKNSVIHEGCLIKGPFALGESAHLNMGAKMKGDNTIGPFCKVGGEVSNSIFFGYSNKGHDGFLGNSVIGEWCNLGADTNSSNLKNNYSPVKLWDYSKQKLEDTDRLFCGLLMGDHSKSGINTMFNTGTVVGVSANIFGGGFPPKFIPSFSWGGADQMVSFRLEKAKEVAKAMMARRDLPFTKKEHLIFDTIFSLSGIYREQEEVAS